MSDLGLFSAPANWQARGLVESFGGRIPVWDASNTEVGYRTSYDSYTVYFNGNYKGQAPLYSLTFAQDVVTITTQASNAAQAVAAGQAQGTPVTTPGTATTGSTSVVPVITQTGTLVAQPSGFMQWLAQNKMVVIASAGAVAVLWLLFGGRR